jgi:MFS family permease
MEVGSQVFILPFQSDPSERITLNIVGLVEPIDPDEEYWMGGPVYFSVQSYAETPLISFYVTEDDFFNGLGTRYPSLVGDYEWFLFMDTSVLTVDTVQSARDALLGLERDINKSFPRSTVLTLLENSNDTGLLTTYQRDLTLARVPLLLFISLVVVVILYFLVLVMGLLARAHSEEASLLRSRGANMLQVGTLVGLGEGIMILLATALGPLLALLLVRYWLLGSINPAAEGDNLSVGFSAGMFILGAIGGLLSLGVLLVSSLNLARLGILEFLRARARPPTMPFLQRYYLDLLVLVALGILLWQIQGREGFVERAVIGRPLEVDPTLLFGPALALLAAAFLVLRFLPFLARMLAWLTNRLAPAWANFTLARMARDPLPYGSLAVIVMLSAALGIFGAAFQSTLSRSQQEQALYDVGGDLVLTGVSFSTVSQDERLRELLAVPGVQTISPIGRDQVSLVDEGSYSTANLVGVDPVTLPDSAWFRDDFSPDGKSLSELLAPLRRTASGLPDLSGISASGIAIPENAESIGIWVNTENVGTDILQPSLSLSMRIADSGGRYRSLFLGEIPKGGTGSGGWSYLEIQLPDEQVLLEPPFSIVAIFISADSLSRMPPGSIGLDDLTAKGSPNIPPEGIVIEGFEEPGRWLALPHDQTEPDTIEVTAQAARTGASGLSFAWIESLGGSLRGAVIPPGAFPLPAIGGPTFDVGQTLRVKDSGQIAPLSIRSVTDYFPSMDSSVRPFLLVSQESYNNYLERIGGRIERPEEFWIALDEVADRDQAIGVLKDQLPGFARIRDRDAAVGIANSDPLAGGSWNGLTVLSITALTIAVVLALGTHAVVSVRNGRVDLTVARVLGFSRRQMLLSLTLERVVVTVLGLVVGSVLGYLLSRWVLGFLDTTPGGRPIIPPVVFTPQAWIIALTLLCLVTAALLAIAFASLSASRLRASDILRTGE